MKIECQASALRSHETRLPIGPFPIVSLPGDNNPSSSHSSEDERKRKTKNTRRGRRKNVPVKALELCEWKIDFSPLPVLRIVQIGFIFFVFFTAKLSVIAITRRRTKVLSTRRRVFAFFLIISQTYQKVELKSN